MFFSKNKKNKVNPMNNQSIPNTTSSSVLSLPTWGSNTYTTGLPNYTPGSWVSWGTSTTTGTGGWSNGWSSRFTVNIVHMNLKVQIVNLKEFQENKDTYEGVVFYKDTLMSFSDFYEMFKNELQENNEKVKKAYKESLVQDYKKFNRNYNVPNNNMTSALEYPDIKDEDISIMLSTELTVPCDCEVCEYKQRMKNEGLDEVDEIDLSNLQNRINGLSQFLNSPPNTTNPYINTLPVGSRQHQLMNNFNLFNGSTTTQLQSMSNDIVKDLPERTCQNLYHLEQELVLISKESCYEYFLKVAEIHENNKDLYNPFNLNILEMRAYVERIRLTSKQYLIDINKLNKS